MKAEVLREACVGCGYCIDICPENAIELDPDMVAVVDTERCHACGVCEYECPALAVALT